jgi:hypothetical protein
MPRVICTMVNALPALRATLLMLAMFSIHDTIPPGLLR